MKKIIYFIIFLLLFNISTALDDSQRNSLVETLDLADDKAEYEQLLNLLNNKRIDLSYEPELSNRILSESIAFGINPSNYKNIKFAERSTLHNTEFSEKIEYEIPNSYDLQYFYLLAWLCLVSRVPP